jgi:uncharacterized protein
VTLKWTVPELLKARNEGLMIDETLSLQDLSNRDDEVRRVSPVHVSGYAEISRTKATFYITVKGEMVLPCSVTLEDVPFPFHFNMSETFLWEASPGDDGDEDEEEIHDVKDQTIDLIPYIEEAILVEKPIRVISEKAKNIPRPQGEGWEFLSEGNRKQQIDPRLAKLKDLLDD